MASDWKQLGENEPIRVGNKREVVSLEWAGGEMQMTDAEAIYLANLLLKHALMAACPHAKPRNRKGQLMAMNLIQHFEQWLQQVYAPDPPEAGSDQHRQLRDAFFSGCLVAYTSRTDFSRELKQYGEFLHAAPKGGN